MNRRIAIFSDIHLGVHQNSDFWLRIADDWVKWFVKDLRKQGITDIAFCGDFFHYRAEVSVKTLSFANRLLDQLSEFKLYMIPGNHDAWYKDTSEINSVSIFSGRTNVTVYESVTSVDVGDKTLTFCPWGTKIVDLKPSDVIFGHFELENFKMNTFKICDHGDDPEVVAKKAKLIITGHFHMRDEKIINGSKILYVGNPFQMDFSDTEQEKGYYILDLDTLEYEFKQNDVTPKHIKVVLSKLINVTAPKTYFKKVVPGNIIKLIIDKNISVEHLDHLSTVILSYKPSELRVDYDVNYNTLSVEQDDDFDLSGIDIKQAINDFVNMLDINNKKDVIEYSCSLYESVK
jgi:DNA repair exonuclease SbcCD nuclease subunit